jgi:GDPmannose 4,6-dehydratase
MYLILQQDAPEDFVIATGVTTRVREFIRKTFAWLGVTLVFIGSAENEVGKVAAIDEERFDDLGLNPNKLVLGNTILRIDPRYYRPTEVELLVGDPKKSQTQLGWKPKYTLETLIADMASFDLRLFQKDLLLLEEGFGVLNYFE